MAILKTPVYIKLKKDQYSRTAPKVIGATSVKPADFNDNIVIRIDVEIDESAFEPIFETNSVIVVGGKNTSSDPKKKVTVKPESIVAGLQEIDNAMKTI